jgi:hypothetical protein
MKYNFGFPHAALPYFFYVSGGNCYSFLVSRRAAKRTHQRPKLARFTRLMQFDDFRLYCRLSCVNPAW